MESNLKFIETWEVAQFKAQQGVEKLEVKQNPHTGKVFFVYGLETGPCSRKVETGQLTDPVVSQVCNAETGEMFMMLISGAMVEPLHWLCFRLIRDSQDRQEALGLSACFFMFR